MREAVLKLNALARLDREEEPTGTFDAGALAREVNRGTTVRIYLHRRID